MELDRLYNVAREEQLDCPIAYHSHLAFETWKLAQVDGAPEKPSQEAAELVTFDFRASGVMTNHAECAERVEMKWFQFTSRDTGAQIAGECARFANRELRRGRAGLAGFSIWHDGAIAQRPHVVLGAYRQSTLHHNCAPLIAIDRQLLQQRIRRCSRGPHERFCCDLKFRMIGILALNHDDARTRRPDAGIELKRHPARSHPF